MLVHNIPQKFKPVATVEQFQSQISDFESLKLTNAPSQIDKEAFIIAIIDIIE